MSSSRNASSSTLPVGARSCSTSSGAVSTGRRARRRLASRSRWWAIVRIHARNALVALEAPDVAHGLEEDLAGDVLGLGRTPGPQVGEHAGGEILVERDPSPLGAHTGGAEQGAEGFGLAGWVGISAVVAGMEP